MRLESEQTDESTNASVPMLDSLPVTPSHAPSERNARGEDATVSF